MQPGEKPEINGEWATGIFDCLGETGDPSLSPGKLLFYAAFCPCLLYGQNVMMIDPDERAECVIPDASVRYGMLHFVCCGWFVQADTRSLVRRQSEIDNSNMTDVYYSCLCSPCALVQERKQIIHLSNNVPNQQKMDGDGVGSTKSLTDLVHDESGNDGLLDEKCLPAKTENCGANTFMKQTILSESPIVLKRGPCNSQSRPLPHTGTE
eukprot:CAMPEP_0196740268 /NCGR_PEP_ID=MMETSP1091-20130531/30816_1 /TAXON_ID=302021 /ORGANISM="Rhodomonas sp., Strain CCMP768" /LENGTH=208 /DNA_ID=CAMNT_0042085333 /DNA_START=21 /DNA_END=645 /DNA_ORIENTATION=-